MKLKHYLNTGFTVALCLFAFACSDNDDVDGGKSTPQTYSVSGKVEKGPFVSGSTITVQPMNTKLQALGDMYTSTIQDNAGTFSLGSKQFDAPYAELTASGYFFNEVSGKLSSGTLNLRAIVDLSDKSTVNVNILTHLKYQRILHLVANGKSFTDANKQAQQELFASFGLQKYAETDASLFSIISGTDESAALIAISSLLIVEKSEANITEYLAKLCKEFGESGAFTNETKQQIKKDREKLSNHLSSVKSNVVDRYKELEIPVEVKELAYFLDWDDDGTAGNETLKEGQKITLETTQLNVPNEGGNYQIKITSPIPVYLTPLIGFWENPMVPDNVVSGNNFYEIAANSSISLKKSIEDNVLVVKVSPLSSRFPKSTSIYIYDCLGNILGTVNVLQESNKDVSVPMLGQDGARLVYQMGSLMAKGFSTLNLVEQYYYYNKQTDAVEQYLHPNNGDIAESWRTFNVANEINLRFKDADAERINVYQNFFQVFSALYYYNMVVFWGDVPYITSDKEYNNATIIPRTDENVILNNLKDSLALAMNGLEEKKNEPLKDMNSFFFVSKDVARIVLANIYMYQDEYANAEPLLSKVIENGFYRLDASNYSSLETLESLWNNGEGNETIFAMKVANESPVRPGATVNQVSIIPLLTYTDVMLSYAECLYKNGNSSKAKTYLDQVVAAKGITVSNDDVFTGIKEARMKLMLYSVGNFAFMKRNNIATEQYEVEDYRLLLPIPIEVMMYNPNLTQNPGY